MDFTANLNPQQERAVTAGLGPTLVVAGPGSGKTRVLTQRIAYLIGNMGVRPYQIMAVTFTNKAAREMESRVAAMLGETSRGVTLGTFHAICARILRMQAEHLPFDSNFVIFDSDDQLTLVKRAVQDLNLDDKRYRPQGMHAEISRAKNELITPELFPTTTYRDEVARRVYIRYQELLKANNAVDFDDLLLWVAVLLQDNPEVRERYARRYEHVLVDEFQDTNLAQYVLLKHLASVHRNIFAVGDTDQSIYRWRGADYRNVRRFLKDFPETQEILLEQNYRSNQNILDAAMGVIDQNPQRTKKQLFTQRGQGQNLVLFEAYDERVQAAYVVDTITRRVAGKQNSPGDFAIMYRTNAQSRILEEAFLQAGLPYRLVGAQRFYGRREVKDVIAYLRLVHNPNDELSLGRAINTPARGIGDKTFQTLRSAAVQAGTSPGRLLMEIGTRPESPHLAQFAGRAAASLTKVGRLLDAWRTAAVEESPLQVMDRVLGDIDFRSHLDDGTEEGRERWENVMELRRLAAEFREPGLDPFLERVALVSDQDTVQTNANVPTLLTLHAAKGLEFPVVFIIGLDEGTLPHSRSFEEPEEMMEERRLMYVGITRAMDSLYLVYPLHRSTYGYAEPTDRSRFLDDIPEEILDAQGSVHPGGRTGRSQKSESSYRPDRWDSKPAAPVKKVTEIRYAPGSRVLHPVWGEGMVLNSRILDDDEYVDIFFEELGLKRVAASLARLELKK